jgi:hypothetical protein
MSETEILNAEQNILDGDYLEFTPIEDSFEISQNTLPTTPRATPQIATTPIDVPIPRAQAIYPSKLPISEQNPATQTPTRELDNPKNPYKYLRLLNCVVGVFHLAQGVAILLLSKAFTLPVTTNYLSPNLVLKRGVPKMEILFNLQIGPVVAGFLLLSALAHFIIILPGIYTWYISNLKQKINKARWIEYALSSSLMIVVIAMLCGMFDLGSLILIFSLNVAMNLFGYVMEQHNSDIRRLENIISHNVNTQSSLTPNKVKWTAFNFGSLVGIVPWIVMSLYFFTALHRTNDSFKVPDFVYFVFYSIFVFFSIFAFNMVLQYRQTGPWKNYTFGEKMYIILSLLAKSALAWQVFIGTLRNI